MRAKLSWGHIQYNLLLFGGGLLLIALAFLPQVLRFFAGAEGNRTAAAEQNPEQGKTASWGDEALTRALASRERPAAVAGKSAGPATFGMRGEAAATGARRQFGVRA